MHRLERFLDPSHVSLKVCGVTRVADAQVLIDLGVDAVGVNFWPGSKRYVAPEQAPWLHEIRGDILRVGVFVNAPPTLPLRLWQDGLIDVIQLHGDETASDADAFRDRQAPFFKAIGVRNRDDLNTASDFGAQAILLDAHAPGEYGGTGRTIDWENAAHFRSTRPDLPLILAGGILPGNAAAAVASVRPSALDTASGVEISPGIKDRHQIEALLAAMGR